MHDPFPISEEQTRFFREDGFMQLRHCLSGELIERLRASVERICENKASFPDLVLNETNSGAAYVSGIDHLLLKNEAVFLELMGSPLLLSVAQAVCGDDFFPVQEFVVIKQLGDLSSINWHQDVVSHSVGTTCMIGIYLDPASEDNGALKIVPGSQHLGTDICALKELPAVSMNMHSGDILVHDLMVAHCSGSLTSFTQRRVVYYEFMNTKKALEDSVYPEQFIRSRKQLITLATAFYTQTASDETGSSYQQFLSQVRTIHQQVRAIKPANYCFDHQLPTPNKKMN